MLNPFSETLAIWSLLMLALWLADRLWVCYLRQRLSDRGAPIRDTDDDPAPVWGLLVLWFVGCCLVFFLFVGEAAGFSQWSVEP